MVQTAADARGDGHRSQSRPPDESDTGAPTPTDFKGDDAADGPASKKRKIVASSRGVANLTPEQLAKKRANGTFYCISHR